MVDHLTTIKILFQALKTFRVLKRELLHLIRW